MGGSVGCSGEPDPCCMSEAVWSECALARRQDAQATCMSPNPPSARIWSDTCNKHYHRMGYIPVQLGGSHKCALAHGQLPIELYASSMTWS